MMESEMEMGGGGGGGGGEWRPKPRSRISKMRMIDEFLDQEERALGLPPIEQTAGFGEGGGQHHHHQQQQQGDMGMG